MKRAFESDKSINHSTTTLLHLWSALHGQRECSGLNLPRKVFQLDGLKHHSHKRMAQRLLRSILPIPKQNDRKLFASRRRKAPRAGLPTSQLRPSSLVPHHLALASLRGRRSFSGDLPALHQFHQHLCRHHAPKRLEKRYHLLETPTLAPCPARPSSLQTTMDSGSESGPPTSLHPPWVGSSQGRRNWS